ncbi:MAG: hypothetical protein MUC87_05655 [Bacteroidia bacterium]|jgi:hypothetical protein|nr:hypothetical protein [Bacteroidia bacterium]
MKKIFSVFLILLLVSGCGNLGSQLKDNMQIALELKKEFEADAVDMNTSKSGNSNSVEINLTNPSLARSQGYQADYIANAVAVEAYKHGGKTATAMTVNMKSNSGDSRFSFDQKLLTNYTLSEAVAESYLMALCDKDKNTMLKLGDPEYLGESSLQQALDLAAKNLQTKDHIAGVQILRIFDSNITNTVIPIHIICYKVTFKSGASKICDMFVRCDNEQTHLVSGFDLR